MSAAIAPEVAKARATLLAMGAAVDLRDWPTVVACLGDRILVDYTSLFGGDAENTSGEALVTQWRAMLPGFDATCHAIGEADLRVESGNVLGTASVVGTHMLGDESWIISGTYDVTIDLTAERPRIVSLALIVDGEQGDRSLTERAKRRVEAGMA